MAENYSIYFNFWVIEATFLHLPTNGCQAIKRGSRLPVAGKTAGVAT